MITRDSDSIRFERKIDGDHSLVRMIVTRGIGEPDCHMYHLSPDDCERLASALRQQASEARRVQTILG
jgi:hypothetical protein